ncbi:Thymidylate kinase [Methanocorpusculaceae archaeon Sp1]|nr:Thymidylate kinase [Methanocorpusculaceae archaeon Sp1]
MLITLEGIDGAGKSTLYAGLKSRLLDLDPLFTREPGSPYLGDAVRRAIAKNDDPLVEAALFVADHAVHLADVVRPALSSGRVVISDRYSDSRFAYQEVSLQNVHPNPRQWLTAVHEGWSVRPDMTILLVVPVSVAMSRLAGRPEQEHFERQEFLEAVQKNYLTRAAEDPSRFLLVDAAQSPETILDFVEKSTRAKLKRE